VNFYTDLFTPETWAAFRAHGATVSGFRKRQQRTAERIQLGDIFLCYLVRLSRWCGVLEVASAVYQDASPIFDDPDPFVVRFKVRPRVLLDFEYAIPAYDESVWGHLSLTRDLGLREMGWAQQANLRTSLRQLSDADGKLLLDRLTEQQQEKRLIPLTQQDQRRLSQKQSIRALGRAVIVDVPENVDEEDTESSSEGSGQGARESQRMQAAIARIGIEMGFRIWVPRNDRQNVLELLDKDLRAKFLEALPLNYDDTTLKTIEQIDVLWLKNRSMARAFEVEHTTAIYSGLLRMADLLALQPNMDIRLHIVAPEEKREKVLREIKRPVFSLLDRGPLYEHCSYLPYGAIQEIANIPQLEHMRDSIIDDYEEFAQDD
jgi:hypothetical protein